ncbi:MAG: YCF48-related protein [Crocinitomicaceae bacterium]
MKTINNQMILKRLLFVISIGACLHLFGQDWNTIKTFTPAQTIQDVIPLNETSWIVSSSLYSGTGLNMKRSIDNGETWVEEYSGYTSQSFRSIASPDGETSFAIANSAVLITDNGTGTWETVDVPVDVHLRDIYFLNETDGWIGADAGVILKTKDGGETWVELETTGTVGGSINDIYFMDENVGFICGFNYFQRSVDGGLTWTDIEGFEAEHAMYQLQEMHFEGFNTGWVCGDIGYIYKTEDGGLNWTAQTSGTEVSLQGISFATENYGFACGFEGTILGTTDGGETWAVSTTDTDEHIMAIDFNADRGIAVSHSGQVLYMDLPFVKLAEEAEITFNIYPNPCIDFLVIESMEWPERALFEIRDLSGRVIHHSLISNEPIDTRQLPDGNYMLYIYSGEKWLVKKFIKA